MHIGVSHAVSVAGYGHARLQNISTVCPKNQKIKYKTPISTIVIVASPFFVSGAYSYNIEWFLTFRVANYLFFALL
jgi:hypothetical protein